MEIGPLISRSDARALFERVVNVFSAERVRPIWNQWARYVYQFGSLEDAQALEKRITEGYPNGTSISLNICAALNYFRNRSAYKAVRRTTQVS